MADLIGGLPILRPFFRCSETGWPRLVARHNSAPALLTRASQLGTLNALFSNMSKQYNKVIKRKRRAAYLKRKKIAGQKTTKTAKK